MQHYKAIFFDWDGTAVLSRKAPVEDAVNAMFGQFRCKIFVVFLDRVREFFDFIRIFFAFDAKRIGIRRCGRLVRIHRPT